MKWRGRTILVHADAAGNPWVLSDVTAVDIQGYPKAHVDWPISEFPGKYHVTLVTGLASVEFEWTVHDEHERITWLS
jgi:hypothetical protein